AAAQRVGGVTQASPCAAPDSIDRKVPGSAELGAYAILAGIRRLAISELKGHERRPTARAGTPSSATTGAVTSIEHGTAQVEPGFEARNGPVIPTRPSCG